MAVAKSYTPLISYTQLKGLQTNLFGMSNKVNDIHMSDLDEETKRILAEVNSDAQSGTDDSKDKSKDKKVEKKGIQWESNKVEDDDEVW